MKKNLLLLILMTFYFSTVFCQTLYTSTNFTGDYFSPGLGASGTPIIMFDDVLIPSSQVQGTDSVMITKVNFGIARLANAPATTMTFYYTVRDDTTTLIGNAITIPPVLIGSVDLPANGTDDIATIVTFGDSVNALFKIKTDTGGTFSGYQTFFLGLSVSGEDPDQLNSWLFAEPGGSANDNKNFIWLYDVDDPQPRSGGSFGSPPIPSATFYLEVFGIGVNNPVPLTLTEFNARRTSGNINILNWKTQQELNTSYFVIERSNDGRNFAGISQVAAAGNSNTVRSYTYTDNHPAKGNNYYRLRSIDKDNSSKLSAIRSIRNTGLANITLYPNPVTDKLRVAIDADKATEGFMTISDLSGKTVYSRSLKLPEGNSSIPLELSNFAAGSYIMKIQLNDDVIVKKFSKQ